MGGHAFITAGTKGLGLKVTEAFLKLGHSVTVTYFRDNNRANEVKQKFADYSLHIVQADVCDKNDLPMLSKKLHIHLVQLIISLIMQGLSSLNERNC